MTTDKKFVWPKRKPIYDEKNRLIEESHLSNGQVIARVTFDPETRMKTSYSSGGITLFYKDGILIRKEVRDEHDKLISLEHYSDTSGGLHSENGEPAQKKFDDSGDVVYMAWYHNGKKHRPLKLNKELEKLLPQPAVVRKLRDGIVENAFYRQDELNDPERHVAAIQYIKGDDVVLKCHFKDNKLHNSDGPAILSTHEKTQLAAHAMNGRFLKADYSEVGYSCSYKFDEKGHVIAQIEEIDLSPFEAEGAELNQSDLERFATNFTEHNRSELSGALDTSSPVYKRRLAALQKKENEQ